MRLFGVSPLFEVSTATVDVLFDFFQNILKFGWCVRVSSWGLSTSLPSRQGVGLSREGNGSLCRYFQLVMRRFRTCFCLLCLPVPQFLLQVLFQVQFPFERILLLHILAIRFELYHFRFSICASFKNECIRSQES